VEIKGKVAVVTGGAQGIGRALCERLHAQGAAKVIVADLNGEGAREVAAEIGGVGLACNIASAHEVAWLVETVQAEFGPIDLYCSNAGILEMDPDPDNAASASASSWQRTWEVNVLGHVHAAQALLPTMIARKQGYFLNTVSAAGLLTQIGSATYSTTKHAALGFSEYLAITHRDDGIRVSVLCPQGVDTAMTRGAAAKEPALLDGMLSAKAVAEAGIRGVEQEQFLILPHAQVAGYFANKATDYGRWIGGMTKLRRAVKAMRG
jgi:NAD(P)-dependent dehydrogenase (short-subunit alcohol dehydrogenase family)